MSNLSIEQRAHDLALMRIKIEAELELMENPNPKIDLANDYAKYYYELKQNLDKVSKEIPDLFS
ncbi:hypothetical protein [Staphylococcus hominis]